MLIGRYILAITLMYDLKVRLSQCSLWHEKGN